MSSTEIIQHFLHPHVKTFHAFSTHLQKLWEQGKQLWLRERQVRFEYRSARQWHPTPVLLPGESHRWRSLVGCSPWGRWESDTTERLPFHFSLSCIGEGNGNPLQCSCLENPRDGEAWWTTVYGVTQSRTRLKWLSSSSFLDIFNNISPSKYYL